MVKTAKGLNIMHLRLNDKVCKAYDLGLLFVFLILLCLGSCVPKHSSYSEFKHINQDGWSKNEVCEFVPQYGDSLALYDVDVALCLSHNYKHRNISIVVDFIKEDSLVNRKVVDCILTDANGNWLVSGFGVLYQVRLDVIEEVKPIDFDKLQVWQGLDCDTLNYVERVGIFVDKIE